MDYAVVLHFTSKSVRFLYMIGKNAVAYYPLDNDVIEMPLAFYVGNDRVSVGAYAIQHANDRQAVNDYFSVMDSTNTFTVTGGQFPMSMLLPMGMEQYLISFLKEKISVPKSEINSARSLMPLFISFSDEVPEDKARKVCDLFYEAGFQNTTQVSVNECLFNTVSNNERCKLILMGRSDRIYVSFFPFKSQPAQFTLLIEGFAEDPRLRVCADYIYQLISEKHPAIVVDKKANWDILMQEAQNVIDMARPIYMGKIFVVEGVELDFMVMKMNLDALLANDSGSQNLVTEVEHILHDNGLQLPQLDVILEGSINTGYFIDLLKSHTSCLLPIDEQVRTQMWNSFFNMLMGNSSEAVAADSSSGHTGRRLPMPATLHLQEDASKAVFTWTKMGVGKLLVYVAESPFSYKKGNAVDVALLNNCAECLVPEGNSMTVPKDFNGQRFYLPVVDDNGSCCAGEQVSLVSLLPPDGAMLDCNEMFAMFRWNWNGVAGVRMRVKSDQNKEQGDDLFKTDSPVNNKTYPLPNNTDVVELSISSIFYRVDDNKLVESERVSRCFSLRKVLVDFVEVRKGGMFSKNKYTVVIRAADALPCGIKIFAGEGSYPTNLANRQPVATIVASDVTPGVNCKFQFEYVKQSKKELFFRLAAADAEKDVSIVITPEFKSIK